MVRRGWHRSISLALVLAALPLSACSDLNMDQWSLGWNLDSWSSGEYAPESGPVEGPPSVGTYITTATVAFRNGPSSRIRLLTVLPPGTVVATDGRALDGWWGVNYQNTAGWVYGSYLKQQ